MSILIEIALALAFFFTIVIIVKWYRPVPHLPKTLFFVGQTLRTSTTLPTVRFLEIFDVAINQTLLAQSIQRSKGSLIALTRTEIVHSLSIADNVPSILEDFDELTLQEWKDLQPILNGGIYCKNIDQVLECVQEFDQVRVSAACLVRLKWGDRYVLMRYKKNNIDGSPRFIPLGGALQHHCSLQLREMGASDFENANDLRFTIPTLSLRAFANWFSLRIDRETTCVRELREELVQELKVLNEGEFEAFGLY